MSTTLINIMAGVPVLVVVWLAVGDCLGRSVPHCGFLVGSSCLDSLHHCPVPGHQLLQKQEAPETSVVQQCVEQHPVVYLCQGV